MVEIVDRIIDGARILFMDDPGRLGIVSGIAVGIFAVLMATPLLSSIGLNAVGKQLTYTCATSSPLIFPFFSNILNAYAQIPIVNCAISNGAILAIIVWFLEFLGLVYLLIIGGIIALNLSG